jgi:hypothetical protein
MKMSNWDPVTGKKGKMSWPGLWLTMKNYCSRRRHFH